MCVACAVRPVHGVGEQAGAGTGRAGRGLHDAVEQVDRAFRLDDRGGVSRPQEGLHADWLRSVVGEEVRNTLPEAGVKVVLAGGSVGRPDDRPEHWRAEVVLVECFGQSHDHLDVLRRGFAHVQRARSETLHWERGVPHGGRELAPETERDPRLLHFGFAGDQADLVDEETA